MKVGFSVLAGKFGEADIKTALKSGHDRTAF
jgi:hypothetical protein